MRPKPRLFVLIARFVRLASSTPWPTASVRAYGVEPPSGNVGASSGSGVSQPDFFDEAFFVAACVTFVFALAVVGVTVVVGAPSVHGTGFHASGCVFV
jgi:hypothetical protein